MLSAWTHAHRSSCRARRLLVALQSHPCRHHLGSCRLHDRQPAVRGDGHPAPVRDARGVRRAVRVGGAVEPAGRGRRRRRSPAQRAAHGLRSLVGADPCGHQVRPDPLHARVTATPRGLRPLPAAPPATAHPSRRARTPAAARRSTATPRDPATCSAPSRAKRPTSSAAAGTACASAARSRPASPTPTKVTVTTHWATAIVARRSRGRLGRRDPRRLAVRRPRSPGTSCPLVSGLGKLFLHLAQLEPAVARVERVAQAVTDEVDQQGQRDDEEVRATRTATGGSGMPTRSG